MEKNLIRSLLKIFGVKDQWWKHEKMGCVLFTERWGGDNKCVCVCV